MEQEAVKQGCFASGQDLQTNVLAFLDSVLQNNIVNTCKGRQDIRQGNPACLAGTEPCNPDQG